MILPQPGLILVEPAKDEGNDTFRYQNTDAESTKRGRVLAVGNPFTNEHGVAQTTNIQVGDTILHRQYGPESFTDPDTNDELVLIRFVDVVARIQEAHA